MYTHNMKKCWTAPVGSLLNRKKAWVVTWDDMQLSLGSAVDLDCSKPRRQLLLLFDDSFPGYAWREPQ